MSAVEKKAQGINFSHGWESSSQRTWQPQTAWLKKKRREEERRGDRRRRGGGILHMMALREGFWILGVFFFLYPKPPCPGWEWANCSSCSLGSPVLPGLKMWVGTNMCCWLHTWMLEIFSHLKEKCQNGYECQIHQEESVTDSIFYNLMIISCGISIHPLLTYYQKCSAILSMSALHFSQGRHWQREPANRCWLKVLVFKWQGALFPLTLSQINWASQVCLWEREDKNQNKRSHWSEDGSKGWLSSLASRSATQRSGTAGHLIPPILSR